MNKFYHNLRCYIASSIVLFVSLSLQASPWMEADDAYVRSDLQTLADAGIITVPVNTFPLPWREISTQIKQASPVGLSENLRQAYYHINYKINGAKKGYGNRKLKLQASQENIPSSFGQSNYVEWGVLSSVEIDEPRFSMRISPNYVQYHDKNSPRYNFDNSYFAVTTGKTNFFINTQTQWWSPSWIESLSAEQRVHPAYELGLERSFLDIPLLNNIYFKTGINQLRSSEDWKYSWRSRLSLRPLSALELSFSYFDFIDKQNSDIDGDYQQLSFDGRFSLQSIINVPLAVYTQRIIDDSQSEYSDFLVGGDYSFFAAETQLRFVFEYRNTDEHNERYSLGSYVQMKNDHQWQIFVHQEKANETINQLATTYRFLAYKGMLSLSLLVSDDTDEDKVNAGLSWELRF